MSGKHNAGFRADLISQYNFYDATVGSIGADYITVKAAIDAGKKRLLIIANTTETANITIGGTDKIYITSTSHDYILDLGDYTISGNVNTGLYIFNVYIRTALTTDTQVFGQDWRYFTIDNCIIDDNSTATHKITYFSTNSAMAVIKNSEIQLSNASGGIGVIPSGDNGTQVSIRNCHFIGGGASCQNAISLNYGNTEGCVFSGTFASGSLSITAATFRDCYNNGATNLTIGASSNDGVLSNFGGDAIYLDIQRFELVENVTVAGKNGTPVQLRAVWRNVKFTFSFNIDLSVYPAGIIEAYSCTFTGNQVIQRKNSRFVNCYFSGDFTTGGIISESGESSVYDNCRIDGDFTINQYSSKDVVKNCTVLGAMSISSDYNVISGNYVGTTAETITLNSGADNNIVVYNFTKAAISDSGTGNDTTGNKTF